jgi:tRNAThr (cytosine32-N3)-methyltransferase
VTESAEVESDDGCFPPAPQIQTPEETGVALDPYPPDSGADPAPASEVTIALAGVPVRISHPLFAINQLGVDRRLLVNRKRQLKMYRVWMQGQFRKIERSGEKVGGEQ